MWRTNQENNTRGAERHGESQLATGNLATGNLATGNLATGNLATGNQTTQKEPQRRRSLLLLFDSMWKKRYVEEAIRGRSNTWKKRYVEETIRTRKTEAAINGDYGNYDDVIIPGCLSRSNRGSCLDKIGDSLYR